MTRPSSIRSSLALAAAASALALAAPSLAQTVKDKVVYDDEIVVTAPYVDHDVTRQTGSVARAESVSVTRVVSARDLDLRHDADVDELRRRIRDTASLACDEAENLLEGPPVETDRQCERRAVRNAMVQADLLVDYRRG